MDSPSAAGGTLSMMHSDSPGDSGIQALPREVLHELFSFLSARDLLHEARSVSKMWRNLALDRAKWEHYWIPGNAGYGQLCSPVAALRLLPCVDYLELQEYGSCAALWGAASITQCGVRRLELHMTSSSSRAACLRAATLILHRQVALARLTALSLEGVLWHDALHLVRIVANAHLTKLRVVIAADSDQQVPPSLVPFVPLPERGKRRASLQQLQYHGLLDPDPLLEYLCELHAASLTSLQVHRLRLTHSLETTFSRLSFNLTSVTLDMEDSSTVLAALTSTGSSSLRNAAMRELSNASVLAQLRHLERLTLDGVPSSEVLDGIEAVGFPPRLRLLWLAGLQCGPACCIPAVKRLVLRVPQLHAWGSACVHFWSNQSPELLTIAPPRWGMGVSKAGLFGHPRSASCEHSRWLHCDNWLDVRDVRGVRNVDSSLN